MNFAGVTWFLSAKLNARDCKQDRSTCLVYYLWGGVFFAYFWVFLNFIIHNCVSRDSNKELLHKMHKSFPCLLSIIGNTVFSKTFSHVLFQQHYWHQFSHVCPELDCGLGHYIRSRFINIWLESMCGRTTCIWSKGGTPSAIQTTQKALFTSSALPTIAFLLISPNDHTYGDAWTFMNPLEFSLFLYK